MHKRLFVELVIALLLILLFCPILRAQDKSITPAALPQRPNISEVMNWLDKNGLAQARVGVRTSQYLNGMNFSASYNKTLTRL